MRVFRIIVECAFDPALSFANGDEIAGCYATRAILAANAGSAAAKAITLVRRQLDQQFSVIRSREVVVSAAIDKVSQGRWLDLIAGFNKGFTFYEADI